MGMLAGVNGAAILKGLKILARAARTPFPGQSLAAPPILTESGGASLRRGVAATTQTLAAASSGAANCHAVRILAGPGRKRSADCAKLLIAQAAAVDV